MTHAERCPVCWGKGTVEARNWGVDINASNPTTCHGCNGKGWVEVNDHCVGYIGMCTCHKKGQTSTVEVCPIHG